MLPKNGGAIEDTGEDADRRFFEPLPAAAGFSNSDAIILRKDDSEHVDSIQRDAWIVLPLMPAVIVNSGWSSEEVMGEDEELPFDFLVFDDSACKLDALVVISVKTYAIERSHSERNAKIEFSGRAKRIGDRCCLRWTHSSKALLH